MVHAVSIPQAWAHTLPRSLLLLPCRKIDGVFVDLVVQPLAGEAKHQMGGADLAAVLGEDADDVLLFVLFDVVSERLLTAFVGNGRGRKCSRSRFLRRLAEDAGRRKWLRSSRMLPGQSWAAIFSSCWAVKGGTVCCRSRQYPGENTRPAGEYLPCVCAAAGCRWTGR